ncbi:MAG: hypothetical protein AB8D78_05220 [Akkermansiaceae bacterium]
MKSYPYSTDYINETFTKEEERLDYKFLRPILLVLYFFLRIITFPLKFLFHRNPYGFEGRCIDSILAIGMKYFASYEAVELMVRHVQIEPLLYRYIIATQKKPEETPAEPRKFNGIDGDYNLDSLSEMIRNNLTIGHDELSYEVIDRFNRQAFIDNIDEHRKLAPEDHTLFSKAAMESTKNSSLQWIGCTNVVIFIVITITVFADLRTAVKALNSFGSDSLLLWAMKNLYIHDDIVSTDLDFYLTDESNRGHFNNGVFFSNPSLYLQNHIAFDEYAYHVLRERPPATS